MKPTEDQIIEWAEEAGVHEGGKDNWVAGNRWETALTLAYEAGRADENEACAKMFNDNESEILWGSQAASAIRARRER